MASDRAKISRADIGSITPQMQKQLANLARAANRRLERASAGQRRSLEYNIKGYQTKTTSRGLVFKQGKAQSAAEYRQRMAELNKFMGAKTTTRKGWEKLKQENISKAQDSLEKMGYDITDDELDTILKEVGGGSKEFYKALENVQAAKGITGDELSADEIRDAIYSRRSDYEATLAAIEARKV